MAKEFKTDWKYNDVIPADAINRWEGYLKEINENCYFTKVITEEENINLDDYDGYAENGEYKGGIYLFDNSEVVKNIKNLPEGITGPFILEVTMGLDGRTKTIIGTQKIVSFNGITAQRENDGGYWNEVWRISGVAASADDGEIRIDVLHIGSEYIIHVTSIGEIEVSGAIGENLTRTLYVLQNQFDYGSIQPKAEMTNNIIVYDTVNKQAIPATVTIDSDAYINISVEPGSGESISNIDTTFIIQGVN